MNKKLKSAIALGLAAAICATVGSLAYFTDRVEVDANVTAGKVGIDETQTWSDNLMSGPQKLNNINPGDSRSLTFTVTNTDNKAIDVRHTIKLSVVDAAGNAKAMSMRADIAGEEMLQFDIFKASDVVKTSNENDNAGYLLKDGAKPVFSTVTRDGTTQMGVERTYDEAKGIVTYYFADSVLDGTGDEAETGYALAEHKATELVSEVDTGNKKDAFLNAAKTAVTYDYVLIFRDNTLNDFQGCKLYVEMVVEAKQHLNTKSSWENIYVNEYVLNVSGQESQDTIIKTAPDNQTGILNEADSPEIDGEYKLNMEATGDASQFNTQGNSGHEDPVQNP